MDIKIPMAGSIVKINVKKGDIIHKKDTIMVVESMKLEMPVDSPADGKITEIVVSEGDFVEENQVVAKLE